MNYELIRIVCAALIETVALYDQDGVVKKTKKDLAKLLNELTGDLPQHASSCRKIYEEDGKIPAIKQYRTLTGCGLKDAKDAIEAAASSEGWVCNAYKFSINERVFYKGCPTHIVERKMSGSLHPLYRISIRDEWFAEYDLSID